MAVSGIRGDDDGAGQSKPDVPTAWPSRQRSPCQRPGRTHRLPAVDVGPPFCHSATVYLQISAEIALVDNPVGLTTLTKGRAGPNMVGCRIRWQVPDKVSHA